MPVARYANARTFDHGSTRDNPISFPRVAFDMNSLGVALVGLMLAGAVFLVVGLARRRQPNGKRLRTIGLTLIAVASIPTSLGVLVVPATVLLGILSTRIH